MSRMLSAGLCALAVVAVAASSARSDWWYGTRYSYYYPTYYYAPPVYYYAPPVYQQCPAPLMPVPVVPGGFAQPVPAPPSQSKEPPLANKKPPLVSESKSFAMSDGNMTAVLADANGKEICRVGFWNVSGRDVTLTVNGKAYAVPRNRNVTLSVSRTFSWQIDGKMAQSEKVAEDQLTHEIVIR
ncbi:MAG TPA: hypothetical protein VE988_11415 [Gemmataceae bacterium]|nr:hypothetical protein [Gemmataceae bacterium]